MRRSNSQIWYLLEGQSIKGPLAMHDLPKSVPLCLWRSGLGHWVYSTYEELQKNKKLAPPENLECDYYYVKNNGFDVGPYSTFELCDKLNDKSLPHNILIWTLGLKKWASIFDYPELVQRWGLTRRKHLRVPLRSSVTISNSKGQMWQTTTSSLSEGGVGIKNFKSAQRNEIYNMKINSDFLDETIEIKVKFVYSNSSFSGFEFINKNEKVHRTIRNYISRFNLTEQKSLE